MVTSKFKALYIIGVLSLAFIACSSTDPLLNPTGRAASVPPDSDEFSKYVSDSRIKIEQTLNEVRPESEKRIYLGGYTNQDAAEMRSPFQKPELDSDRCNDVSKGAGKGFFLIHGLTDSPYLMRSISDSLFEEYPCSLIRAVLLPGHGTVAGDSLKMKFEDWRRITTYGVKSFETDKAITDLYIVGFSTGTSLAIDYIHENPSDSNEQRKDKIKGLILVSPAVKAKSGYAWLAPIVKWFKRWGDTYKEKDAARYESFSINAGAEFYKLTKGMTKPEYALDVPVLMAVSADDETIDARAARKFFCYPSKAERRALIWYQSIDPDVNTTINSNNTPELMCDNIIEVELGDIDPNFKTLNLAHVALSMSPEDPHYGVDGKYHNCKAYDKENMAREFDECQGNGKNNIFGEKNIKKVKEKLRLKYDYLRRGTFNPDYKNLEERILCFTNKEKCPTSVLVGE